MGLEIKFIIGFLGNISRIQKFEILINTAISISSYELIVFLILGGETQYD